MDYPDAAHTLLTSAARAGELELPSEALAQAALVVRGDVDKQVAENDEVANLVRNLEQQYDDLATQRGGGLLPNGTQLPTADELGAEFEKYLSTRPDKDT